MPRLGRFGERFLLRHLKRSRSFRPTTRPGNLLVDEAGTLWITDFGLAHSAKDVGLTITGELLGRIPYMSRA